MNRDKLNELYPKIIDALPERLTEELLECFKAKSPWYALGALAACIVNLNDRLQEVEAKIKDFHEND